MRYFTPNRNINPSRSVTPAVRQLPVNQEFGSRELRVRHVDLINKQVEISETFARTLKGSNHAARVQKGTKTENTRRLPLTDDLVELMRKQIANKQSDDFVFPFPKELSIDDQTLQKRILRPVLRKLRLGDRNLYAARHSFDTRQLSKEYP